jgi:arylsulfatase A-like enzyme
VESRRPNILIIMTDDQRAATLRVMPAVRRWFRADGTRFPEAYATTPQCCPSRASIFTGQWAHNHGVNNNEEAEQLRHRSTIHALLKQAGYRTAISGKFLNKWGVDQRPPFFDRWAIFDGGYHQYPSNVDGDVRTVSRYSTHFVSDHAVSYLERFERHDSDPWLLYVTPYAPHLGALPERRYRGAAVPPWKPGRAVGENTADKPPWVRSRDIPNDEVKRWRRRQLRTLMSVDDMVGRLMRRLGNLGERRRTLALFMSDNGYYWGEHGLIGKALPYSQDVHIPLILRWRGHLRAGARDERMAANVDVAPTVLEAAGVRPERVMDGRSLLTSWDRDRLLFEYTFDPGNLRQYPTWASTRTDDYQYVEYYGDGEVIFREYYDMGSDPHQLRNLYKDGDPTTAPPTASLSGQLGLDRNCIGSSGATACP